MLHQTLSSNMKQSSSPSHRRLCRDDDIAPSLPRARIRLVFSMAILVVYSCPTVAATNEISENIVEKYTFSSAACQLSTFQSDSQKSQLGNLVIEDPSLFPCTSESGLFGVSPGQDGMYGLPHLRSQKKLSHLQEYLVATNVSSISFDVWILPSLRQDTKIQPIVSMGPVQPGKFCHDFALLQQGNNLLFEFIDNSPFRSCTRVLVVNLPEMERKYHHIAFSLAKR